MSDDETRNETPAQDQAVGTPQPGTNQYVEGTEDAPLVRDHLEGEAASRHRHADPGVPARQPSERMGEETVTDPDSTESGSEAQVSGNAEPSGSSTTETGGAPEGGSQPQPGTTAPSGQQQGI